MKRLFLLAVVSFLFVSQSWADDSEWLGRIVVKKDNLYFLEEDKIIKQDIQDTSSLSIAEALSKTSPHFVIRTDSNRKSLFKIRGFDQRHIVVMLDGVPIYVPYDGVLDLDKFAVEDVGAITIASGLSSVLYGPNALGGAVNIETKKPLEPLSINAWAEFSEHQTYYMGQTLSVRKNNFYARVSGQEGDSNAYRLSESFNDQLNQGTGKRINSDRKSGAVSFLFGYEPNPNYEYAFRYSYLTQEYGIPPSTIRTRPKYWRFDSWEKETYSFLNKVSISDNVKLRSNIFYDTYFNILDAYDDVTYATQLLGRAFHSTYDDHSYGGNVIFSFDLSNLGNLDLAFNTKYDRHRAEDDYGANWDVFSTWTHSAAIEYKLKLTERLNILTGLLYEYFDPEEANGGDEKGSIDSISPQGGISFDLKNRSQVYLKVGKRTRFPTLKELYSDRLGGYAPNPDLSEQDAIHYNVGYTKTFSNKNKFEVSLFRSDVDNLIESVAISDDQDQMQNISKVVFQGVEIDSKIYLFDSKLVLEPYYYYLYAKNKSANRVIDDLEYRPRYQLGTNLKFETLEDLFVFLNVGYVSWQRYENSNSPYHWQTMGGYAKIDFKLEKRFKNGASAWFRIDNLLDRDYEGERGFPMPGRAFFVGFKYNFE